MFVSHEIWSFVCASRAVEITVSRALVPLIRSRGRMLPASPRGVRAKNWRCVSAIIRIFTILAHAVVPSSSIPISSVSPVSIAFRPM